MSAVNLGSASDHVCYCGKRFLRKEHLRRHQATHREPTFVCEVCERAFTRSDILRRHSARHASESVPEPRTRRACYACHSNKTKCDGGSPCSLCTKRGIECLYSRPSSIDAASPADISAVAAQEFSSSSLGDGSTQSLLDNTSGLSSPTTRPDDIVKSTQGSRDDVSSVSVMGMRSVLNALNVSHGSLDELLDEYCLEPGPWSKTCIDAYLEHFHIHWPIIHSPTFNLISDHLTVSASVIMIGCWLRGPNGADELVIAVHQKLVGGFIGEMCKPEVALQQDEPWRIENYQAVLLNVIFAFYSNREQLIARATMLLGLLVVSMRQIGIFSSEIAASQEKAHFTGTFLPFLLSNREKRIRLVSCLFKIDIYFSLVSGQCPRIHIEELDVGLPSTFALWNAYGLEEFWRRHPLEPNTRTAVSLFDFIQRPRLLDSSAWLVEDVHIGLCGMYWAVWRYNMTRQNGGQIEPHAKDQIANQLDSWKFQLDRASNDLYDPNQPQTRNASISLQFYFGSETKECPATLARVRSLIHDATLLYNAIGLYLYSDIPVLNRFLLTSLASVAEAPAFARSQERKASVREWTISADSKNVISFCSAALQTRKNLLSQDQRRSRRAEPLVDLVLWNRAAALSAWFEMTEYPYSDEIGSGQTGPVDLQAWINTRGVL